MKLLAIETATAGASVALGEGRNVVASAQRVDRRGHGSFLVSALDFCFDQAGWTPGELDAIVVDVGPGLYTGIRVGLATAQGLAAALGVPVIPGSSLNAMAVRAATGRRHIWSIVDVRRGEFAVASYNPVPGGVVRDGASQLVTPDHLRAMIDSDSRDSLMVGDVEALPESFFNGLHRTRRGLPRYPAAEALLELAVPRVNAGEYPHPSELRPLYMREPDVKIGWDELRTEGPWFESA
ncbi:MAG: tRNA (adenosine(37)-N6)-threonylcarbamoyltransferase complex dimerization subunit type 1 TsaB [Acidimicrobiia bacterium]|nr:tRNA (adenosine(37)-N6)-threonylcarbamoyltransferase complex dimerization subunit type 1 TsaB [Acidimicrobiia bacterium]MDH5505384.1 tRNA (adenosine(37)-N6)-threonylcarbamoyltransferase complex dimerization subunit type 1 TsaB [Acidimicrobiia bacterium]